MCQSLNYLPLFLNSLLKNIKVIFERVVKYFFFFWCVCFIASEYGFHTHETLKFDYLL